MPLELDQALGLAGALDASTRDALISITTTGDDARRTLATAIAAQAPDWDGASALLDDLPENDWEATQAMAERVRALFDAEQPPRPALEEAVIRAAYALGMGVGEGGAPEPLMRVQPGPVERARILGLEPPPVTLLSLEEALDRPLNMSSAMRLAAALKSPEAFTPFARAVLERLASRGIGFDADTGAFGEDVDTGGLEAAAAALTERALSPAFPVRQGVQAAIKAVLTDEERARIGLETLYARGVQMTEDGELISANPTGS